MAKCRTCKFFRPYNIGEKGKQYETRSGWCVRLFEDSFGWDGICPSYEEWHYQPSQCAFSPCQYPNLTCRQCIFKVEPLRFDPDELK